MAGIPAAREHHRGRRVHRGTPRTGGQRQLARQRRQVNPVPTGLHSSPEPGYLTHIAASASSRGKDGGSGQPAARRTRCSPGRWPRRRRTGTPAAGRASDGKKLWAHPASVVSAPALASGVVYARGTTGELLALRATDGQVLWHFPAPFSIGPVVAGRVVCVSDGARVYAVPA
ncbi:MAG TPA: PQQ-binding-like beta-propeller repeat protein [Streptosporangiaceae bacterium]